MTFLKNYARVIAASVVAFAVVFGLVFVVESTQAKAYSSRVALIVEPPADQPAGKEPNGDYVSLSGAMLPAVSDLVHSPAFMQSVVEGVPGNPDASTVASGSTVEIVPSSIVIRVSMPGTSENQAIALATNVSKKLGQTDIFGGLARLVPVETGQPSATQTAPDKSLGKGLALLAGAIAAALVSQLMLLRRPRLTKRSVSRLLGSDVAVLDLGGAHRVSNERMLTRLASLGSCDVVAVDDASEDVAAEIRAQLQPVARRSDRGGAVLVAQRSSTHPAMLKDAISLARAQGERIAGIVIA